MEVCCINEIITKFVPGTNRYWAKKTKCLAEGTNDGLELSPYMETTSCTNGA